MEESHGTWKWKRVAVSDDGMAIVAMTSQQGAPSLWLWTDHKACLPQQVGHTTKVSFTLQTSRLQGCILLATSSLCPAALAAAGFAVHACMVGCPSAQGLPQFCLRKHLARETVFRGEKPVGWCATCHCRDVLQGPEGWQHLPPMPQLYCQASAEPLQDNQASNYDLSIW